MRGDGCPADVTALPTPVLDTAAAAAAGQYWKRFVRLNVRLNVRLTEERQREAMTTGEK